MQSTADIGRDNRVMYGALQDSLLGFAAYVHAGRDFEVAPHIRLIADALERIERGELKRLIISVPPRHGKSTLVSSIFAAWYLGRNPDKRVVVASYGSVLSDKASRAARRIVQGKKFQRVFPDIELSSDSASIQLWDIKGRAGGYQAASVGGVITGFGANLLIIDDPHKNRAEANSEIERQKVYDWYTSDAYSRLEPNPAEGAVVLVHTRFHPDDLIGRMLEGNEGEWEVINCPAISLDDDGNEVGLWWPLAAYHEARAKVQPLDWQALWMGEPIIPEGDRFHEEWFKVVDRAPDLIKWVRYWDLSLGLKGGDWSVGVKAGVDDEGNLWIGDVQRVRKSAPEVRALIKATAARDGEDTIIGLPNDLIGTPLMQELRRDPDMLPYPMFPVKEQGKGDKAQRATAWQSRAAAGQLRVVKASWNADYVAECVRFPNAKHDDCVDATTGAYDLLWNTRGGIKTAEKPPANNTWAYFDKLFQMWQEVSGQDEYDIAAN